MSWTKPKLDCHTLNVVRGRLGQVADAKGSLTKQEIIGLISNWMKTETIIPAMAAAGRIRKLQLSGKWDEKNQKSFKIHYSKRFVENVMILIEQMNKKKSNRI